MKPETLAAPVTGRPPVEWGSDAIAELLNRLGLPYLSMVPGSSCRGLQDSVVNYLGNTAPQIVTCLHEEHSVAIAHGYAKVTGRPMAVGIHSNVGLMHASMAIYNAYCDRVPMLLVGATGPLDAAERRPWIDWVHTSADQGALVRHYVKWDDQPGSVTAALEAILRGTVLTGTEPAAPVYVCLDSAIQESPVDGTLAVPDPARYPVPTPAAPDATSVDTVVQMLRAARRPLLLIGRGSRTQHAWDQRVALAERLGASVLTDIRTTASFPTDHPNHPAVIGGGRMTSSGVALIRDSDLVVGLNWTDLGGTLSTVFGSGPRPPVIACRNEGPLLNGWTKDHFGVVPSDIELTASPDALVTALLAALPEDGVPNTGLRPAAPRDETRPAVDGDTILMADLARELREAATDRPITYTALPLGWRGEDAHFTGPLDYLGRDGGGGLGSGPGIAVGAALALDGTGRLPVAVLGDGDYLMGSSALWSAAHHRLPLLVVVANNRAFHNDVVHQERVALSRHRPPENKNVGQSLQDPDPDLAAIARGHGLTAHGPVVDPGELGVVLAKALRQAEAGETVLVDVRVDPYGYAGA
ncbi:thiamine pyrophosphate-binding protein [Streptomyces sp. NBC_01239]|uniref:thiamine pyrophosphate-binding protein n=1 Tax=Streptomyces sp. NBC_01239 TaxID=2903792 RepID=UPI00225A007D|nr:thiamine pyrophosphate-binding protein [Streptomyces sp. NBC_01239]MCX4817978.1 thiamine pyrophosphate-binding protein [Streptomyces sp. NBC_01239]